MIKKSTLIEMLILVTASVILLMALLSFNVNAQGLSASSNNGTLTRAEILKQRGVPGKGIDNAPGLQKPFNSLSASSNNVTPTRAEILKQHGVPGKGIDNAPGLQKPFNSTAAENAGIKEFLYRFNHRFQEMIQKYFPLS